MKQEHLRGFMKRLPLCLLILLLIAGCAPSVPATSTPPTPTIALTAAPTVAPSGLVDVGEYALYYECIGEGSPTVIFESGYGVAGTDGSWAWIMMKLAPTTRACAYDRVNRGKSDIIDEAVTSQQIADDLHALLHNAGIPGPYLLVAHSIGGYHARVFAETYRDEMAGLILIDASHPDQSEALLDALPEPAPGEPAELTNLRAELEDPISSLIEPIDRVTSADQVRATGPYGDLPLIVLSRDTDRVDGTLPLEIELALNAAWASLQRDLAGLSTNSTHLTVAGAGHGIHLDQPQVVVDAILTMIDQIRSE
jgi:pimeloyl-ACP methyl ester carboxylesterase